MKARPIYVAGVMLGLAALCSGQKQPTQIQGIVYSTGSQGAAIAGGPFRNGGRLETPPPDVDAEEDGDDEPSVRKKYPPFTPEKGGASFTEALRELNLRWGQLSGLPYQESLFGATGGFESPSMNHLGPGGNATPRSTALTTAWTAPLTANANQNDPQVAVSSWAVGVLTWNQLAFYDKSGTLLPGTPNSPNPTSTQALFAPAVQFLDANLNLNPQVAGNSDFTFAKGQVGDARIEFDTFRKRWVILATAKNNGQPANTYSLALIRSQRRTKFLLAVSLDEDPRHGFWIYFYNATPDDGACNKIDDSSPCPGTFYTPGDGSDYPSIGISSRHYILTIGSGHQHLDGSDRLPKDNWAFMIAANADDISKGLSNPAGFWFKKWSIGKGETADWITQPAVSRQVMNPIDFGLVALTTEDRVVVTGLTPTDPPSLVTVWWDMPNLTHGSTWPQKGSPRLMQYGNIGNAPLKATQISGILSLAFNDCRNWGGSAGPCAPAVHLFTANVNLFPFAFSQLDRVFGLRNAVDDAPNDVVAYGMPGIAMNQNRDIALVYSRSSPLLFPEARYSTWLNGEPDVRASALLRVGDAAIGCATCKPWTFDTAGIALDPFDQTGIWMGHLYGATNGQASIAVGKVFGKQHPGLMVSNVSFAPQTVPSSGSVQISYTVANYGDGAALKPYVQISLPTVTQGGSGVVLGYDPLPVMAPGQTLQRTVTLPVPPTVKPGTYRMRLDAKVNEDVSQYTEGVNFVFANQPITIQ